MRRRSRAGTRPRGHRARPPAKNRRAARTDEIVALRPDDIEALRAELERSVPAAGASRWNADPEDVQRAVAKLVLTLVEFLRKLLERQAIRRMEARTLTATEVESVGLALMLPSHVIGATGAGDVKLLAAFGTLLGPGRTGWAFLYSAIAGGAIALIVAVRRQRVRMTIARAAALLQTPGTAVAEIEHPCEDNRFAYAPAIVVGALAAAIGL